LRVFEKLISQRTYTSTLAILFVNAYPESFSENCVNSHGNGICSGAVHAGFRHQKNRLPSPRIFSCPMPFWSAVICVNSSFWRAASSPGIEVRSKAPYR